MTPQPPFDGPVLGQVPPPGYDVCNSDRLPVERIAFVDTIHR